MSLDGQLHEDGQRIKLLAATTISANVSPTATTPVLLLSGMRYLVVQAAFLYGAGGGTVDAYIQTSIDGGSSWIDIMNFHFTTSAGTKVSAVVATTALAAATVPTDGSLSANTILSGLLGDRIRLKWTSASTAYSGATSLQVDAIAKG